MTFSVYLLNCCPLYLLGSPKWEKKISKRFFCLTLLVAFLKYLAYSLLVGGVQIMIELDERNEYLNPKAIQIPEWGVCVCVKERGYKAKAKK